MGGSKSDGAPYTVIPMASAWVVVVVGVGTVTTVGDRHAVIAVGMKQRMSVPQRSPSRHALAAPVGSHVWPTSSAGTAVTVRVKVPIDGAPMPGGGTYPSTMK